MVYRVCGPYCYLVPKTKGFPICPKCSNDKCQCQLDCGGVLSAYRRARQYKHEDVAKLAKEIYDKRCK